MRNLKNVYDLKARAHAKVLAATGFVAGGMTALNAFAADDVDTSAIVAKITAAGAAAAVIGTAVLSMHYGIKLYKWIKGAG